MTHWSLDSLTPPHSVTLAARAGRGDLITIAEGTVTLRSASGEVLGRAPHPVMARGDRFEIALKAKGTPGLARMATAEEFR
ncbi:MAG: hypothetical protein ACT4OK_21910 [Gemmobacter sp.]